MNYSEYKKRKKEGTLQNEVKSSDGTMSYSEYKSQYKKETISERLSRFESDYNAFIGLVQKDYDGLNYGNASSKYDYYSSSASALRERATDLKVYIGAQKGRMSDEDYNKWMSYFNNIDIHLNEVSNSFYKANEYYSRFKTEDEYNTAVKQNGWYTEYSGKTYQELQKVIDTTDDDELRNWLTEYAPTVMTDKDYQREINGINNELSNLEHDYNFFKNNDDRYSVTFKEGVADWMANFKKKYGDVKQLEARIEKLKAKRWELENKMKYSQIPNAEDFGEKSAYVSTKYADGFSLDKLFGDDYGLGYGDVGYEYVNNVDGFRDAYNQKYNIYNMDSGSLSMESHFQQAGYDYLEEDEIKIYNYLKSTQGTVAASEYLRYMSYTLEARRKYAMQQEAVAAANEHPVIASAVSIPQNLMSGVGFLDVAFQNLGKKTQEAVSGEYAGPIHYNSPSMDFSVLSSTYRGTVANNIADATGVIHLDEEKHPILSQLLNGKSLGDVYQLGMSMADSAVVAIMSPFVGSAGTVLLGGSAATQTMLSAVESGATDEQALLMGMLSGAFEMIFEKYELENLLGADGSFIKKIINQGLTEGIGEGATTIANTVADIFVLAENSEWQKNVAKYISDGYTPTEAQNKAFMDAAVQVGWDFVGGVASGIIMAGVHSGGQFVIDTIDTVAEGRGILANGGYNSLRALAETVSAEAAELGVENNVAKAMQKADKKASAYNVGKLSNAVETARGSMNEADIKSALVEKGMSEKEARVATQKIIEVAVKEANGIEMSEADLNALKSNPVAYEVYNSLISDPGSSIHSRNTRYAEARYADASDAVLNEIAKGNSKRGLKVNTGVVDDVVDHKVDQAVDHKVDQAVDDADSIIFNYTLKGDYSEAAKKKLAEDLARVESQRASAVSDEAPVKVSKTMTAEDAKAYKGKTTYTNPETGETQEINITGISSIENGEMMLKLDNGESVSYDDVRFSSEGEALVYSSVLDLGANAGVAEALVKNFKDAGYGEKQAGRYALGIADVYNYGALNIPMSQLSDKSLSNALSQEQREYIYKLGQSEYEARRKADKAKQEASEAKVSEAKEKGEFKHKEGQVIAEDGVTVDDNGEIDESGLNDMQKANLHGIKALATVSPINYHIFRSNKVNGEFVATINGVEYEGSPNGVYMVGTNDIWIDLNAGNGGEGTMLWTANHEISHYIRERAADDWQEMAEFVIGEFSKKKGKAVSYLLDNQIAKIKERLARNGETMTEVEIANEAYEDLVCDALSEMLIDGSIVDMLAKMKQENKTWWDRFKEAVEDLLKRWGEILGVYKGRGHDTAEAQMLSTMEDTFKKLQDMYAKAFAKANEVESIGIRNFEDFAKAKTTDGEQLFQYRAMEADEATYREMLSKWGGMTDEQITNLFATIDKAMDIIKDNLEVLDYAWEADINDRAFSPVKPNSDSLYKVSLDFSTLCRKRILQQTIIAELQAALEKPLSREDGIAIRDALMALQEEGRKIEVACALCYVESARMKSPKQIEKFLKNREKVLREFFASKSGGDIKAKIKQAEADTRERLHNEHPNGIEGKDGKTKLDPRKATLKELPKKYADEIREAKKSAKQSYKPTAKEQGIIEAAKAMTVSDFTSPEGLENLAKYHSELFDAYTSYVRNATKSKGIENDTWWRAGDSQKIGDVLIANMNRENGLRSQSWSDFQVVHILDYIAATIELSTRNAKEQAYTKVPDYVELMGQTGVMINMSLIPTSEFNGTLEYDSTEGIDYKRALALRKKYPATAGTICIGIDNKQIQMLLADINIDYVIPYHRSGMAASIRKLMHIPSWSEFEKYQGETKLSDAEAKKNAQKYGVKLLSKSDPNYHKGTSFSEWFDLEVAKQIAEMENKNPSDPKKQKEYGVMYGGYMAMQDAANNYLKLCAERGLAPKFSHEKADFTAEDNYWKLLIDRKMVNNATGGIIEQQTIKPVFEEGEVLRILNDELERYPGVKADQDYAVRKVTENFLSGNIKSGMSAEAIAKVMKKPVDNVTKTNIMASAEDVTVKDKPKEMHSERVTDKKTLDFLNEQLKNGDVTKVYRAMQAQPVDENGNVIKASVMRVVSYSPLMVEAKTFGKNGKVDIYPAKLFSPMAGMVNGKWSKSIELNEWEETTFDLANATTVIDKKTGKPKIDTDKKNASYGETAYFYGLVKGGLDDDGKKLTDIPARYNPYIHTSLSALNDQFSSANKRAELVTVECIIPNSELTSGFRAEGAKDKVGAMSWHSGPTSSRLAKVGKARTVILTRYDMPVRVLPDSEVAQAVAQYIGDTENIAIQGSTVTPSLARELMNLGISVLNEKQWDQYSKDFPAKTFGKGKKTNPDIRYSERNKTYMDAVERGDMETAQRLVDEAAKEAGYTARVFHGTNKFGFTKTDVSKSDDRISFFATDSEDTAITYSTGIKTKRIADASKNISDEDVEDIQSEIKSMASDLAEWCSATLGVRYWADYDYFESALDDIFSKLENGASAKSVTESFDEFCTDLHYEFMYRYYQDNYEGSQEEDETDFEETEEYEELSSKYWQKVEEITSKFTALDVATNSGVYDLYANTDNHMVVECNGGFWNNITAGNLPDITSEKFKKYGYRGNWSNWTTRSVSAYAKDMGYSGVTFKGLRDSGNSTYVNPATVYIFFDPQTQVKSADTITYDDNGKVIPLSERFKASNDDIRYSERKTDSNRSLLANALESAVKGGEERNLLRNYKTNIRLIEAEQEKLAEINAEIARLSRSKAQKDIEKVKSLRFDAEQAASRINNYDRELLRLEAMKPLKDVLKRERGLAAERQKQKNEKILKDYKVKVAESRKKATEGRHKTVYKHKIKGVISELNTLLNRGNKEKHVKKGLRDTVATAIASAEILFSDDISNEMIVRNGFTLPLSEKETGYAGEYEKALKEIDEYKEALEKLKDSDDIGKAEKRREYLDGMWEQKRKLKNLDKKLSDAFERERIAYNRITTETILKELANVYAKTQNADEDYLRASYDDSIRMHIENLAEYLSDEPTVRDMSLDSLQKVYRAYRMVLTAVKKANTTFKAGKAESISTLGNNTRAEIEQVGGSKTHVIGGKLGSAISAIKSFDVNNLKPVHFFKRLGSKTLSMLYENVRKGEDTWAIDITEAKKFKEEVTKKYGADKWDYDKPYKFKSATGKEFTLTLEQMMSLYAYSKREQAIPHLEEGGFVFDGAIETYKEKEDGKKSILKYRVKTGDAHKITQTEVDAVIAELGKIKGAIKYVDEMQDYLSTVMGAKGNEVSIEMYGVDLFNEKFYFPLKSATQYMFEQNEVAGEVRIKNSSFSKETKKFANNPIILSNFMDVWANHVNDMSMYHAFVLPLEDFNRVYNYHTPASESRDTESVKQAIQNAYDEHYNQYISQLLKDLNGGVRVDPRESIGRNMIGTFKKAKVFGSASVVIQQPSAVARALALIDAKYFDFNPKLIKHKQYWEEVKKYAPVAIIKEMGHFDTDMGMSSVDYIRGDKTVMDRVDDFISKPAAYMDELTWVHIWTAVKRETMAKNKGLKGEELLKKSGERFTEVITQTQVYDSVLSRSANMRSKSMFMNMLTSFMAEPTTSINMIENAVVDFKRGNKAKASRTIASVAASVVLNSLLVSFVYAARDDDEDETYWEKYLGSLTSEIVDGINPITYYPILKDIWSVMQGYEVKRSDMTLIDDLVSVIKDGITLLAKDTGDMDEDELAEHKKEVISFWHSAAGKASSLVGLPVDNIIRDVKAVFNVVGTAKRGQKTSGSLIGDEVLESIKGTVPVWGWFPNKSKQDKLYDAIVSGDKAYINRLKSGYKNDTAYINAVSKALRENDPRIREAAEARLKGDNTGYKQIVLKIKGEGHFSQDEIIRAINSEMNALEKGESSSGIAEKPMFTNADYYRAALSGDSADVNAVKEYLIESGKKESNIESSFNSSVKDAYEQGEIDSMKAISLMVEYGGKTSEEANISVKYVDFKAEHPDYADSISESRFAKYYEPIDGYYGYSLDDMGISVEVYADYCERTSGIEGVDNDGDGKLDSGSKKRLVMQEIDALPLTTSQKDALYFLNGWSKNTLYEAPWR